MKSIFPNSFYGAVITLILKPGKDNALLIGSTIGFKGELTLPVDGDYIIQVYQMRNSARKNKTVKYTLDLELLSKVKQ